MKKKLFDSFVDLLCPWCNEKLCLVHYPVVGHLHAKEILICKECQKWDHQWGGFWSYDRVIIEISSIKIGNADTYVHPLIKVKEYYDERSKNNCEQKPT
jgi:uncharacterized protein YbaR (Trm112 family)